MWQANNDLYSQSQMFCFYLWYNRIHSIGIHDISYIVYWDKQAVTPVLFCKPSASKSDGQGEIGWMISVSIWLYKAVLLAGWCGFCYKPCSEVWVNVQLAAIHQCGWSHRHLASQLLTYLTHWTLNINTTNKITSYLFIPKSCQYCSVLVSFNAWKYIFWWVQPKTTLWYFQTQAG